VTAPLLGGILGLLAAATFAFNNASARRGVLTGSVAQAMAITVPIGVPIFFAAALIAGSLPSIADLSARSLSFLAGAGIIHFIFGRYCNYRGTKAMGANLVGPVQQLSLPLTLGLAIWILGETLTVLRILGITLVMLGPALTLPGKRPSASEATTVKPFEADYAEGYFWALLSAIGYGVSPILVTLGLQHKHLGASLVGGLVAYGAAALVALVLLLWPGRLRHVLSMSANELKWFTLSGILVCLSQMFLYMAYTIAPLSVVTPIQRLSNVLRLYAGWLINREHEVFSGGVILGTLVSLIGAITLSVDTELAIAHVHLPDLVVSVARWHWP
jgi:uncharacterized membrane protein